MSKIVELFLSRPKVVVLLFMAIIAAGLNAYLTLPREADPDIDVPVLIVTAAARGISVEDNDRLVARPLEARLEGLEGLEKIRVKSRPGITIVVLEFDIDFDRSAVLAEARALIDEARTELPDVVDFVNVTEINLSSVPVIGIAISGDVGKAHLIRFAEGLSDELQQLQGVLEVNSLGIDREVLNVEINSALMESYGLSPEDVLGAIRRNNFLIGVGRITADDGEFGVKVPGLFGSQQDISDVPLKVSRGQTVKLGDVALISRTFERADSANFIDGVETVYLEVVKRNGANIIDTNLEVRAIADLVAQTDPSINLDYLLDASEEIGDVVFNLQNTIILATLLVVLAPIFLIGLRASILVALAVPSSFLIAFLCLQLLGFTINIMVLFGMIISVGIVVDASMVIVEYADRCRSTGMTGAQAFRAAAKRMFGPVFSATATTIIAFLPLLLWPGVAGQFMSFLPTMVVLTLTSSYFVAMLFVPALGILLSQRRSKQTASEVKESFATIVERDEDIDRSDIKGGLKYYAYLVSTVQRYPFSTIILVSVLMAGITYSFAKNPNGVEFFTDVEPQEVIVHVSALGNLALDEKIKIAFEAEKIVREVDDIAHRVMSIGGGVTRGFNQNAPPDSIVVINSELKPYQDRRPGDEVIADIRERMKQMTGVKVYVEEVKGGPPTGKDILLQVRSSNYDDVLSTVSKIRTKFDQDEQMLEVTDTRQPPGIEWRLVIDKTEAARFGADIVSTGNMVSLITQGLKLGEYRPTDSDDEIDILLRLPEDERLISQLQRVKIRTRSGLVPISNFSDLAAEPVLDNISRADGEYDFVVAAALQGGATREIKQVELAQWMGEQTWPDGVSYSFLGSNAEQRKSEEFLPKAGSIALASIFFILLIQFNSIGQSLLALSTIVLSSSGVLLGMLLTGQSFSVIMTGSSLVVLAGVVVGNAIIFFDSYNDFKERGFSYQQCVFRSSLSRVRPVLSTVLTTVAGLIPSALDVSFNFSTFEYVNGSVTGSWWIQFSTAIIFGLSFSTIITLILIPAVLQFSGNVMGFFGRLYARTFRRQSISA